MAADMLPKAKRTRLPGEPESLWSVEMTDRRTDPSIGDLSRGMLQNCLYRPARRERRQVMTSPPLVWTQFIPGETQHVPVPPVTVLRPPLGDRYLVVHPAIPLGRRLRFVFLPFLGFLFLPWTTLMYFLAAPEGLVGLDFLWLGIGVIADIASYAGGGLYGRRRRVAA
jgi:hypothetical protein